MILHSWQTQFRIKSGILGLLSRSLCGRRFYHFCGSCFGGHDEASLLAFEALRGSRRHQRTPFQQKLGAQMGTVFAACAVFFFKHGAQSCGFSGLAFGCVFRARFWARLLTCAARVPIFMPKFQVGAKNTILTANYLCPLLWRPVALELWSGSMNVC